MDSQSLEVWWKKCKTRSPVIFIMSSIYSRNEEILKWWKDKSRIKGKKFVLDGIMYRGEFCNDKVCKRLPSKDFKIETETWEKAPVRFLFITKDYNESAGIRDIRDEVGGRESSDEKVIPYPKTKNRFHKNIVFQLYGLGNTTPDNLIKYKDVSDDKALKFYDTCALARINVKKQAGQGLIENNVLKKYICKYSSLLQEQILNLDADIIVCGGAELLKYIRKYIKKFYKLEEDEFNPGNGWIYYNKEYKKIVISSWHPSYRRIKSEEFYTKMIDAYVTFLTNHPEFAKPYR